MAAVCAGATAQQGAAPGGDEQELQALLQVLAEETDLATRTRENADYVPGIVSVLTAEEARALGAHSALDAIALLPGIEVNRDTDGAATLRVRGIDAFFNSGNVKILVDGLDTSYSVAARNSATLLMPLQLVERIEVIRGPGSAVFGDYALNGLVNIVTRKDSTGAFAGFGAGGERLAGGSIGGSGEWQWQFNAARETSDRFDAPARVAADESRTYADLRIAHGGFTLKGAGIARDQERMAGNPPGRREVGEHVKALEARYDWRFGVDNRIGVWSRYSDANYSSPPLGFIGQRTEVGSDLNWRCARHLLLAEVSSSRLDVERALLPPAPPLPPNQPPPPGRRPVAVSTDLPSQAVLLQDQFDVNARLTLTGGLRYDRFADVTTRVTPRLAAVWRVTDTDTLKAQYGEGFRTPIAVELYDSGRRNTHVDFESARTSELAWIHRRESSVLRATAFRSELIDFLTPLGPPGSGFHNAGKLRTQGVELEASVRLIAGLRLNANVTKLTTARSVPPPGQPPPPASTAFGTPDLLANVGLIGQPNEHWTFGANWNHVGDRYATPSKIKGYSALNLSIEHHFAAVPGLSLRGAMRNASEADVTYALSRAPPNPPSVLDYGARVWSVELVWRK
jgi:iron complex outermembrane receptor protein